MKYFVPLLMIALLGPPSTVPLDNGQSVTVTCAGELRVEMEARAAQVSCVEEPHTIPQATPEAQE